MTIQQFSLYSLVLTTCFMQGAQEPAHLRQQRDEAFKNTTIAFHDCQKTLAQLIVETPEGRQVAMQCRSNSDSFDPRSCQRARFQLANTERYKQEYDPASEKFRSASKTLEALSQ